MQLPLALLVYIGLGGAYLVVLPAITLVILRTRWYTAGSWERVLMFFLVFFTFPGLLLLGPFVNWRPQRHEIPS